MTFGARERIALVGTHTPRQCGIATFTADLARAMESTGAHVEVVAVLEPGDSETYVPPVTRTLRQEEPKDYARVADWINDNDFDSVCVQHEFGIYGGESGKFVSEMCRRLNVPIVTTLHTILARPSPEQWSAFDEIVSMSAALTTMSQKGRSLLQSVFGVDDNKIFVVPHGIPSVGPKDSRAAKAQLDLEDKRVLLTFGLLSPDKGIEQVVRALPTIVESHPELVYIVVGATHPKVRARYGESYRESLTDLAKELGVSEHLKFENRFVSMEELTLRLQAADVYVTPYLKREQITSGALAYAFGCGNAVVATPYWHAEELLADDRGLLVPFGCLDSMAGAITGLLDDDDRLKQIQDRAYRYGQDMQWPQVGREYIRVLASVTMSSDNDREKSPLAEPRFVVHSSKPPLPGLARVLEMTDDVGIIQHATYSVPNRVEGYCLDDNARALSALTGLEGDEHRAERATTAYLSFVLHAFDEETSQFRNFMGYDRKWLEKKGSQDSFGRGVWSLGSVVEKSKRASHVEVAAGLLYRAHSSLLAIGSPRAMAFATIGLLAAQRGQQDEMLFRVRRILAERLHKCLLANRKSDWVWFEDVLAYDNATLCRALIESAVADSDNKVLSDALGALTWLMAVQTDSQGHFSPIGSNGFYRKGRTRAIYDQQPVEAWASVEACIAAFEATGDSRWSQEAHKAHEWFHGRNSSGTSLVDPETGGCFDGLTPDGTNMNLGAESTLSLLASSIAMSKLESVSGPRTRARPYYSLGLA